MASIAEGIHSIFNPPKAPPLMGGNALSQQPTQAQSAAAASKKTLEQEQAQASTSTVLSGGQGLLDQPSTTSRTLIGG